MKILVLGGDGFCGWPTALHLSAHNHDVLLVDNFARRTIDIELGTESLTPIQPIEVRLEAWYEMTGRAIGFVRLDVAREYHRLRALISEHQPHAILHFAGQRAAPYSMKSAEQKRYTVENNLTASHNLLAAMVEAEVNCHLIHLGTMGVYGYDDSGVTIPEGYLNVEIPTEDGRRVKREMLYPADPGSVYHLTKALDQLLFQFYCKNDGVMITDLHQGIVWGTETAETAMDERLINRFDYDGDFGTVLNRFVMQAAVGHPLTVHGTGGQIRAFTNINDTVQCIRLAVENPPTTPRGQKPSVRIANQMTETHRVRDLAKMVSRLTGTAINFVDNPRRETAENELVVANDTFLKLGLNPVMLQTGLLTDSINIAARFANRCDQSKILCKSRWTNEPAPPPRARKTRQAAA